MADDPTETIKIRQKDTLHELEIPRGALPFFINQDYEVLTDKGNVSKSATTAVEKGN